MKTRTTSIRLRAAITLLLAAGTGAVTAADTYRPLADPFYATFPTDCSGAPIATGLCLLASTRPLATGGFTIRPIVPGQVGVETPVVLNQLTTLSAGDYLLYRDTGLDQDHETIVRIRDGEVLTLKTAAVKFRDRAGRYNRLQHFQARATPDGQGCSAEVGNRGVGAYLPGNYQVSLVPTLDNAEPEFAPAGAGPEIVTFNLLAGQGVALRRGRLREQTLAAGNRHRRGNGGVSLSNIGPLRSDLSEVGFLPRFQSFHGIHSPGSAVTAALVLSGAPAFHFVIPVQVDRVAECGVSLAAGGLPAHLLMTDCQFDGDGRLTDFRVNAGSYYGLHNLHGKSAIAATVVNSPVVVSGVQFDLEED